MKHNLAKWKKIYGETMGERENIDTSTEYGVNSIDIGIRDTSSNVHVRLIFSHESIVRLWLTVTKKRNIQGKERVFRPRGRDFETWVYAMYILTISLSRKCTSKQK